MQSRGRDLPGTHCRGGGEFLLPGLYLLKIIAGTRVGGFQSEHNIELFFSTVQIIMLEEVNTRRK